MAAEVKPMETKKQEQSAQIAKPSVAIKKVRFRDWLEELKAEIKSVHWTSKEELKVYTQIVVGATFFFGMGVYLVDLAIHGVLNAVTWIARFILG